jgi:hypothetical protein
MSLVSKIALKAPCHWVPGIWRRIYRSYLNMSFSNVDLAVSID